MRLGINLRGDLAKLDDAELASRFEMLIGEREQLYRSTPSYVGNKWFYQQGWGTPFGRGPLHARIFYKLIALFFGGYGGSKLYELHLTDCELKDLRDEIQRRVDQRKKVAERRS